MFRIAQLARANASRSTRMYSSSTWTPEGYAAAKEHAQTAVDTWKKISLFLALPACAIMSYVATKDELEHIHHLEHDPPKFVAYPYLHVRKRKFPYGDGEHTPFWNPLTNPDPEE
ncbi:Cytochrome c oxidase subunit 6A1, mitochondrial [Coemansia sp. RSA 989]|nr:cytochrome c oxidase, subunit VIa [Coemansia mojavensis]KAJ1738332.1 Cytochrome c oxidase subunit 6A1, mitochondrial [Coemansia sp. RSA 1086]KAJ1746797.1 Cytochrome c oxidase subunit 6A1, mitochondrial [Coemansia sp. RSA 1821]KAJ1860768.1 Cytochrome c oxidase subunit 6A1, mitochondrial [Coemansia sp. RSA 989]KAJ1868927.1 Cytochrome c oxidase subunit 6A1, mitochondrial [Coemansia sp. RSA 990]KAJ2648914.1 Cytochrome c oxidase subunit 6A1, mitochondrial [Coemansia sp. RSA 1250]KAJ2668584.1 Cy